MPTSAYPLTLIVLISMAKDGYEDYVRAKRDEDDNSKKHTKVLKG